MAFRFKNYPHSAVVALRLIVDGVSHEVAQCSSDFVIMGSLWVQGATW